MDFHLTFYTARHTFATETCLSNGVPIETISKMMGHSNIRTTQIYAEITNQKSGVISAYCLKRPKIRMPFPTTKCLPAFINAAGTANGKMKLNRNRNSAKRCKSKFLQPFHLDIYMGAILMPSVNVLRVISEYRSAGTESYCLSVHSR